MLLNRLNGWHRLGVLIGIMTAIPVFMVQYDNNYSVIVNYKVPEKYHRIGGTEFDEKVYREAASTDEDVKYCSMSSLDVEPHYEPYDLIRKIGESELNNTTATITCEKTKLGRVYGAIPYAIIPFILSVFIGCIVSWVVSGFRNSKKIN